MDKKRQFYWVSVLEGASFLILLFIAMPLKYGFDWPLAVKYVGWAHGLLFVIYQLVLLQTGIACSWKFKFYVLGFLASILPFGPFIFDKKVLKNI